ncbi:MAG: amidohydrolase family protein [Gammaproteobacteria bacterium]|uniref:Amidohydrolase n=1 Tax=Candidatus Kutchimonas denitrificans TaxID=3056748 RepID=A0AAE4ZAG9_9BACT|nr:amidohydrolase [Gemmatimonadota bacterium]NIR75141.1 amidohydrolase [Candidatus Kutchimonas denitrificans]NIU52951.1 amidohydrolase family protein [Gemmatimonadota bacterium]NIV52420.1 amidohydrolase family protein [Gammaproteobacteria bacterium]NIY44840.1 amidohydrolase family protein [Gemmatimonadota bacterium]
MFMSMPISIPARPRRRAAAIAAPFVLIAAANAFAQAPPAPADLILTDAVVHTVDVNRPTAEAVAIRGDRIVFVGSERGALTYRGRDTRVIDLAGRAVYPGFIDSHGHLAGLGNSLRVLDLVGTRSLDEIIDMVEERAASVPAGTWIQGRGWDQNDWSDTRFPHHRALSEAVPDHPVVLGRVDGHALLANAKAMEIAGITNETPDPEGGRIVRDPETGEATGVFVDAAESLIYSHVPAPNKEERRQATLAAVNELLSWGVTSIHDAGVGLGTIELYKEMAENGEFRLRNYIMMSSSQGTLDHYFERGPEVGLYEDHITVRSIKMVADGALGSRGAALLEPYSDEPDHRGLVTENPERIEAVAAEALERGFQVNVHAIGDRGNRIVLDAFEEALAQVPVADHRFRVEHAQVIHWQDIPRFAELDVLPSMQQTHQMSDMYWAIDRLGWTRSRGAYAWRSLLETGVVIPAGTDFPVESVNPFRTFLASITRSDEEGWPAGGWFPEQKMTREEALKSMTIWGAYAAFEEDLKGSLTEGKLADLVVLSQDIMAIAPERILDTRVEMTVLGGEIVYTGPGAEALTKAVR